MELCFWKTSREASEVVEGYGTQAASKVSIHHMMKTFLIAFPYILNFLFTEGEGFLLVRR